MLPCAIIIECKARRGAALKRATLARLEGGRSFKWRGERKNPNMQTYKDNFHTHTQKRQIQSYKDETAITKKSKSRVGQEGHSTGGGKEESPVYISTLKSKVEIYCYGNRILYWVWV